MGKLLAMASTAVQALRDFPERVSLTLRYLTPRQDPPAHRENFRALLDAYATAIREGQADGTVRDGRPRHLAQYVGGLVLAQAQVDPGITGDPEGIPLEDFLDILRRALAPGPE
jgi:hypothetical protein